MWREQQKIRLPTMKADILWAGLAREATGGFEPPIRVLQTLALTTWPRRRLERETGFEPATFSLARRCSTPEPLPHDSSDHLSNRQGSYTASPEALSSNKRLAPRCRQGYPNVACLLTLEEKCAMLLWLGGRKCVTTSRIELTSHPLTRHLEIVSR